jgi:hypothetical protein
MARLFRIAALSAIAILAISYLPSQTSAASVEHVRARGAEMIRGHEAVVKRKRSGTPLQRRCKPKSTSSTTPHKTTTSKKPSSTPPKKTTSSNTSSGGDNPSDPGSDSAVGKVGILWGGGDLQSFKTRLTKTFVTALSMLSLRAVLPDFSDCTIGAPMFHRVPRISDSNTVQCSGVTRIRLISPP